MIIVDIDGTISKVGDRIKYLKQSPKDWDSFYNACFDDEPIREIIDLVYMLSSVGHSIVFCTGRRESTRKVTESWITKHFPYNFYYHELLMRLDNDFRHDTETKIEACSNAGILLREIKFVLEDRNSMVEKWRSLGVKCLQVADGDF
jgi:acid phosphatase class B